MILLHIWNFIVKAEFLFQIKSRKTTAAAAVKCCIPVEVCKILDYPHADGSFRWQDDIGRVTCVSIVKRILFLNSFEYVWKSGEVENDSAFLTLFQNRLVDCAQQSLLCYFNTRSKGEHYRLFQSLIEPERYWSVPLQYRLKHGLSNFRCSCHQLMIEKGRHMKIDRTYRLCPLCLQRNIYCIENECLFLLVCPVYADIRERHFIDSWWRNYTSEHFLYKACMTQINNLSLHLLDT